VGRGQARGVQPPLPPFPKAKGSPPGAAVPGGGRSEPLRAPRLRGRVRAFGGRAAPSRGKRGEERAGGPDVLRSWNPGQQAVPGGGTTRIPPRRQLGRVPPLVREWGPALGQARSLPPPNYDLLLFGAELGRFPAVSFPQILGFQSLLSL